MQPIKIGFFRFIISIITGVTLLLVDKNSLLLGVLITQIIVFLICITEGDTIKWMKDDAEGFIGKMVVLIFDLLDIVILESICIYLLLLSL